MRHNSSAKKCRADSIGSASKGCIALAGGTVMRLGGISAALRTDYRRFGDAEIGARSGLRRVHIQSENACYLPFAARIR